MTTLYLKYRPQKISELDLTDVRDLLSKIVYSGEIPHAFLFEGPRGSGKTSAARIIAKVLNCENLSKDGEPCNKCEQCVSITKGTNIDVAELDAASHRGIDDVRLIRESVKLAPARAKKKVYIIDEAHMLTTEASNALLKTLEEPPEHAVFILATTNPEKLLDTIKSRTVRVKFKKATKEEIFKSLEHVVKSEKKTYQKEVLDLISKNVDGSFRDAKKILEELIVKDYINDLVKAQNFILSRGDFNIDEFFKGLYGKDLKGCIQILGRSENAGVPSKTIYNQIIDKLKELLFSLVENKSPVNMEFTKSEVMNLSDIFITFWNKYQNDVSEYMPFYLSVVKWCEVAKGEEREKEIKKSSENQAEVEQSGKKLNKTNGDHTVLQSIKTDGEENLSDGMITDGVSDTVKDGDGEDIPRKNLPDDVWKRILGLVRTKNASTEALLRASKPAEFDGKKLLLGVYYKFHKEKLESYPHKIFLEDCIRVVIGESVKVECFLTEPKTETRFENTEKLREEGVFEKESDINSVLLSETNDDELMKLVNEVFGA